MPSPQSNRMRSPPRRSSVAGSPRRAGRHRAGSAGEDQGQIHRGERKGAAQPAGDRHARGGIRTPDFRLRRAALYPLSYSRESPQPTGGDRCLRRSISGRRTALLLLGGVAALGVEPPRSRCRRRPRRPPRARDVQRARKALAQPLERELAIAGLAAGVLGHRRLHAARSAREAVASAHRSAPSRRRSRTRPRPATRSRSRAGHPVPTSGSLAARSRATGSRRKA